MFKKTLTSRSHTAVLLAVAALLIPQAAMTAQTTISAAGAIAPPIQLAAGANLNFGEIVIPISATPGFYEIDHATGTPNASNATQVGTSARGSFTITGRSGNNVDLTIAVGALTCDNTYLGAACSVAEPTFTATNTFTTTGNDGTGLISSASCTGVRCTDTVYVGGRMAFTGAEEGRWTTNLTITANYQ